MPQSGCKGESASFLCKQVFPEPDQRVITFVSTGNQHPVLIKKADGQDSILFSGQTVPNWQDWRLLRGLLTTSFREITAVRIIQNNCLFFVQRGLFFEQSEGYHPSLHRKSTMFVNICLVALWRTFLLSSWACFSTPSAGQWPPA